MGKDSSLMWSVKPDCKEPPPSELRKAAKNNNNREGNKEVCKTLKSGFEFSLRLPTTEGKNSLRERKREQPLGVTIQV